MRQDSTPGAGVVLSARSTITLRTSIEISIKGRWNMDKIGAMVWLIGKLNDMDIHLYFHEIDIIQKHVFEEIEWLKKKTK